MRAPHFSSQRPAAIGLLLLGSVALGACRHRAAVSPTPTLAASPPDEYCWWTSIHTALPVDTVGGRFTRAFAAVGLTHIVSRRVGDTVLVRGGPTELTDSGGRAVYAGRAVAYQLGDSTRLRWYSSIAPRSADATTSDSSEAGARHLGFCGRIGKAITISGMTTRDPTAADSIAVWERVP